MILDSMARTTRRLFLIGLAVLTGLAVSSCGKPTSGTSPDQAVRIAVIGENGTDLKSLLESSLSSLGGISLVEREELNKLVDEKRLSTMTAERQFAALGALLSADGLLVLDAMPDGKLTARLVSVHNGACLVFAPVAVDLPLAEWVEGFSRQVARAAPMTRTPRADALPVSVINLRASVFTPASASLEKALTRLLELRLGDTPGVVLLDRRRLGDVAFERSLDAADLPPLWNSTVLIDGALEISGGSVNVNLRLRHQDASLLATVLVEGKTDVLPALADSLAAALLTKLEKDPAKSTVQREPQEFLDEAAWAWRSGLFDIAEEALAAARALGDKSAGAVALETWLLTERAAPEGFFYAGKYLKCNLPGAEEQIAFFERAFASLAEFQAILAKHQAEGTKPVGILGGMKLQMVHLKRDLVERVSEFIDRNDKQASPLEVSALRRQVREAIGLGDDGTPTGIMSSYPTQNFVPNFAEDEGELIRYYEKLLRVNPRKFSGELYGLLNYFPVTPKSGLGARFCGHPGAASAWDAMWKRFLDDPATRLRALFVLSRDANGKTPEQDGMYREFLHELGRQGKMLFERGQLEDLLACDGGLREQFQSERTDLFVTLCETLPVSVHFSDLSLNLKVPSGREQQVMKAFYEYRARCQAAVAGAKEADKCEYIFNLMFKCLLRNNPSLDPKIKPGEKSQELLVHHFWHTYAMETSGNVNSPMCKIVADDHSIWINQGGGKDKILEVELPGMITRTHTLKGAGNGWNFSITPEAFWIVEGMSLVRVNRGDGSTRAYTFPFGCHDVIGTRVFVRFGRGGNDMGLAEIDLQSGEFRVLISARRNPPQSPFDNSPTLRVLAGVISGPGGKLCVVVGSHGREKSGIFELGGTWEKLVDMEGLFRVQRYGSLSLIVGGETALFIDPSRSTPEWWLAGPERPESDRKSARWLLPPGVETDLRAGASAFRDDELFAVQRDGEGVHSLRWWFKDGPREGVEVPLRFELGADTLAQLEPLWEKRKPAFLSLDALKDPTRSRQTLDVLTTPEGLVLLRNDVHGFWFIPNADLDAWRKEKMKGQD